MDVMILFTAAPAGSARPTVTGAAHNGPRRYVRDPAAGARPRPPLAVLPRVLPYGLRRRGENRLRARPEQRAPGAGHDRARRSRIPQDSFTSPPAEGLPPARFCSAHTGQPEGEDSPRRPRPQVSPYVFSTSCCRRWRNA
ncbi:hypothetical protein GCM10027028_49990 [Streptomyces sundarbansensis]